jgi:predicted membrane chloride channel (bestrophin family)
MLGRKKQKQKENTRYLQLAFGVDVNVLGINAISNCLDLQLCDLLEAAELPLQTILAHVGAHMGYDAYR